MNAVAIIEAIKLIGGAAGAITTIIAFITLISKKPRDWFAKTIREESRVANNELKEKTEEIERQLNRVNSQLKEKDYVDLAILRNAITQIYFKYKTTKIIPNYDKQNVISLYEQYIKLNGNSYIKTLMKEMETWEEI